MKNLCRGLTGGQIQNDLSQRSVLYPGMTRPCTVTGHGLAYSTSHAAFLHASMFCSIQSVLFLMVKQLFRKPHAYCIDWCTNGLFNRHVSDIIKSLLCHHACVNVVEKCLKRI